MTILFHIAITPSNLIKNLVEAGFLINKQSNKTTQYMDF